MIILIHPPSAKPSEPPAGIARLSGMLNSFGYEHVLLDANIEGMLYLLNIGLPEISTGDPWTLRAFRNCSLNLSALRSHRLYQNPDRYRRAVRDIGKVLTRVSPSGISIGLADYEQKYLSPLKSSDLLTAAAHPEQNPFFPYFSARLRQLLEEWAPTHIGISLNFLSQALTSFSMAGFIRREFPSIRIIMGGGLVTSWGKRLKSQNHFSGLVDEFVSGPGELQLLQILGIEAKDQKTTRPDYKQLPNDLYLSPDFILPYSASTGCYWNRCDFCPEKAEGNRYEAMRPDQVIADLKILKKETSPVLLHLLDNAISSALLDRMSYEDIGIPWYGFARVSQQLADPDFCRQLKKAGCRMLKLGIESGDQGVLDRLDKGMSIDLASVVLRNLKDAGIAAYVYLLFGTPPEDESSARRTLSFTALHSDCINFLNLAIFNMPVCNERSTELETKRFSDGDLSLYTDFVHPFGWDRKKVRLFLDREFRRHPAVSQIIKRELPVFTSNHAPFFV